MSTAAKFAAVMTGDLEQVRQLGAPIEVVGDVARGMICAPPGHRLLVADFTGIESVVTAWNAGQQDKAEQWAKFFRTRGPHDDPYYVLGRLLGFPVDTARAKGKIADLAFGYQGGAGAYQNFAPENDTATKEQIEGFKHTWRNRHPQIVQSWYGTDRAAIAAVARPGEQIRYGRLFFQCERIGDAPFLFITLPSGRRLSYPFCKLITNRFDKPAVEFLDNSLTNGGWTPCNHGHGAYGGLWTENIVSGIARDLLAAAMTRLEAAGYPVVLHVHDEIVCELPDGEGSLEEFKYLVEQVPEWAAGLPIASKVRNGPRFAAIDAPVEHVPGATGLPALKPKQKQAMRPAVDLGPIVAGPPITDVGFNAADPRGRLVAWAIEREKIRVRKEAGQPWPWTTEPILAAGRFCNVHREHDRVTRWIAANVVERFRDDPDLWFAITLARCINEPDAIAELTPYVLPFSAAKCLAILQARQERKEKVFRTEAYKPPTPPTKGTSTAEFLIMDVLAPMWCQREVLRPRLGELLATHSARLEECYRIGPFLAAQVVADLKPVALKDAADYSTYARPGPGSARGLNRARSRPVNASWSNTRWHHELLTLHAETAERFVAAGLEPVDAQDLQNCLCEWDKHERARDAGGKTARPYKQAGEPARKPRAGKKAAASIETVPVEAPISEPVPAEAIPVAEPAVETVPEISADLLAAIDADEAAQSQAADTKAEEPAANKASEPPKGDGFDNAQRRRSSANGGGSKSAAEQDTYAEDNSGKPFDDAWLIRRGYQFTRTFDYTLPDKTLLYEQRRYELRADVPEIKGRSRKRFLPRRQVNGAWVLGAGPRGVLYNWPAVMRAGPGNSVFVTEGEANADALTKAGLLATTVLSHKWTPECVAALTGFHSIILADHGPEGDKQAGNARRKLAPVAASSRIVPALHLWKHLPGAKEPEPEDDVEDWLALGGDPKLLLDICREIPAEGIITAESYRVRGEADIAPWQWLYGRHLLRGEVAGTAAMGGTGKSTLSIVEALAMASGRALAGKLVSQPLRVVLINLEDTRNSMDKRITAAMRQFGLTAADIGDRLIVIAKGEIKIKVARQSRSGDVERNEPIIRALINLMLEHRADVLSIDSFVRTHRVNENDNSQVQEVVECFEDVASEAQCAVHLWHHTRKAGGEKATVEAARGAVAFIDACRSVRILETMTAKEHEELLAVQPDMLPAGFYFRGFNGKRNFAPPAEQSDWFKLESVLLANGDDVGVTTMWLYPESRAAVSPEVITRIFDEIGRGLPDGRRYSNNNAATERAAWPVVQQHCPDKTKSQCQQIVAAWIKQGRLREQKYHDPEQRRQQMGLFVRKATEEPAS
jgi:hypothetical protein